MDAAAVLNRKRFVHRLQEQAQWDVIIIGGGATGLGIALDSASRGYATLLLEQSDFAKGTSSRSTKLVHGGVRYLAKGDIKLVYDALRERGILLRNAAHLVKKQLFIIPCYTWFSIVKYFVGLKLYDWLSARFSFGASAFLWRKQILSRLPGLTIKNLKGGIAYYDGQFDDARLAINIARTSAEKGAAVLNYFKVNGLIKENNRISGVSAVDLESNTTYTLQAKVVVNATGVFVDDILQMDQPGSRPLVRPSQGIHLVVNKSFLNSTSALMIPETDDGRVLFAVPWHNHVLLGTTDTPLEKHSIEPRALKEEISFILRTVKKYLQHAPAETDVLSVFAGLRPLAAPDKNTNSTKEISRDHKLMVSRSGLVTITGGKWTTYRKMAEETVDTASKAGKLPAAACNTKTIPIHGCVQSPTESHLAVYGTDEQNIRVLIQQNPSLGTLLCDRLPYTKAEVVWAVQQEMAMTVEDVLARRLRLLFLDAEAAIGIAPQVAGLMASELQYDAAWEAGQLSIFTNLAKQYLLKPLAEKADELPASLAI